MDIRFGASLTRGGHHYQQCLHVTAIDLDIVAVHMAYVQCTLLHIPAMIRHGDTLRGETYSVWRHVGHVMGFGTTKLARIPIAPPRPAEIPPPTPPNNRPAALRAPIGSQLTLF